MIRDHAWFATFILFVKMGLNKVKCKKRTYRTPVFACNAVHADNPAVQ